MKLRDKTLEECIIIFNREIPDLVKSELVHLSNGPLSSQLNITSLKHFVEFIESDKGQSTQAQTKFLQNYINMAIIILIDKYNLPIQYAAALTGFDYKYVGNSQEREIEVKCSGQEDGSTACIGNLKLLKTKTDLTLIFRYGLEGWGIRYWQTLTINDSNRKWQAYNDPNSKSGMSHLSCMTEVDLQDIKCYSGSIKPNRVWVKFVKEDLDA